MNFLRLSPVILSALVISTPLVIINVMKSGLFRYIPLNEFNNLVQSAPEKVAYALPETHRAVFNPTFTYNPTLKILAMGISIERILKRVDDSDVCKVQAAAAELETSPVSTAVLRHRLR